MAFSSQSFKAPKIKKGNFSSPLSSGAVKTSTSAPKLKATKISFIKKENSPIVEAVNNNAESLTQTNEILIEIQKQLAFDFANRIAEEKDAIKKIKAAESRRRFGEEEKAVEGTNKIKKGLFGAFDKVMAPAKGIFDKLLDFFSIVLTGFIGNQAFEWLKKKENRDKITGVLNWVGENWKLLVGLFVGAKLLGPIGALISFGTLLSKLFRKGGPLGPNKLKNAAKNSSLDDCSRIKKALDNCSPKSKLAILQSLGIATAATTLAAPAAAGTPAGTPVPADSPQGGQDPENSSAPVLTPEQQRKNNPVIPSLKPVPADVKAIAEELIKKYRETGETQSQLTEKGFISVRANKPTSIFGRDFSPKLTFNPQLTSKSNKEAVDQAIFTGTLFNLPASISPIGRMIKQGSFMFPRRFGTRPRLRSKSKDPMEKIIREAQTTPQGEAARRQVEREMADMSNIIKPNIDIKDPAVQNQLRKLGFSIGENTGLGVKNLGGFLGPVVPFVLNLFKPESVQGTAPTAPSVANQTVSIDAVNMNNPYMMITPEIYGMYAV